MEPSEGKKYSFKKTGRLRNVKVARLQSEFWHELFFELQIFLQKKLRNYPRNICAFLLRFRKKKKRQIPHQISLRKIRKIHRRVSAGEQNGLLYALS